MTLSISAASTAADGGDPSVLSRPARLRMLWLVALLGFLFLWRFGEPFAEWAFSYPSAWRLPLKTWITAGTDWLVEDATFGLFSFTDLTRFVAAVIDLPYRIALGLLSTGVLIGEGSRAVQIVPPLSWIAIIGLFALLGLHAGGWRLAVLMIGCFGFIAIFGHWHNAMITLASILIAVPLGVIGGLLLGIAAYRWPLIDMGLRPVLDLMQTIPIFAYLVPILVLFGFGPTAAVIATVIYAMPPMARITTLAMAAVSPEIKDLGRMAGCTRRQLTWRVMVPSIRPSLMLGVNQVIMLSLNMVIIASMIGAGGLGFEVLAALRRLDIGTGLEAGMAIVALAVALDRLSQNLARKDSAHRRRSSGYRAAGYPLLLTSAVLVVLVAIGGLVVEGLRIYPEHLEVSTGAFWSELLRWINVNFFDQIDAFKNFLLLNLLIPIKRFLLDLPWLGIVALLGLAGWSLAGWRLAFMASGLALVIAATGQWTKAMTTVYLCGVSVLLACMIGIPIGLLAAQAPRLRWFVLAVIDTLQTLPSFVYLMPAVMLFQVGDFTAMIAVVAYAIVPAIRYTIHGLIEIDPRLIEAGIASGCTSWQILVKIKIKLALPEIMLGINQTIMLALSMLVITALVGTRDLGQEVYIALTKADIGRGLVAGLAVAFIGMIADRLIAAGATRLRHRLGLRAER